MIKISVIISNYNEKKFVRGCLSHLKKIKENEFSDIEIIVKDQDSRDGSREIIQKEFPEVILIEGENEGLSKGYNKAVKASKGKYLLFLGMDAFPDEGAVKGLYEYFESTKEKIGAATVQLYLKDKSLDMDAHRGFPTPWTSFCRLFGLSKLFPKVPFFNQYFMVGEDLDKEHEIDLCISHFMFMPREVYDDIGGYDEDFFLYGEDVDTCYRIKEKGWKIMYLPQFKSLHWKGGAIGIRKSTRNVVKKPLKHRLKMQELSAQAMNTFMRKHYMDKYPKIVLYVMFFAAWVLGRVRVFIESFKR